MSEDALTAVHRQIMWDRLIAVVEEQAQVLIRTGFSTSTREAGDVSAAVFDTAGQMLAQAVTGTPGHVNSMARAVRHFLARFPLDSLAPGDTLITNNPWQGTGHLHDFTVVTPAYHGGRAIALFACTSHVIDIGGRCIGPDAAAVYEEGLHVPIMRFAKAGTVNQTLVDIIAGNVREPVQVIGDIYSLAACNDVGCRRLLDMMREFKITDLEALGGHILDHTRDAMHSAIRAIEPGSWTNAMRVDGYENPIDLVARLTVEDTSIAVDFAGTSPPSAFGINVPFCYTEAYASFGIKCIVAPSVPNNAASLDAIAVSAPPGTILSAEHPLPVATRHIIGQMLPDVVFGCLAEARRTDGSRLAVPAEGTSCLWNLFAMRGAARLEPRSQENARPFTVMGFHSGGTGGRPGKDGLSATAFPSGVRNVPVEITEADSPIIVWRKEYRTDSGGPGRHRGGLGQVMEVGVLDGAPFTISANYDRVDYPARGRDGGLPGAAGAVRLASGTPLRGKGQQGVPAGERVIIEMPGGGGIGPPGERPPGAVARDVCLAMVSREEAAERYAVALSEDGSVDVDATERLRANRACTPPYEPQDPQT